MEELDKGYQIIEGENPVLIVAGHNFNQIREEQEKLADLGSGEVARNLCNKFECWGLVSTRIQADPNFDIHSPFREEVRNLIKEKGIKLLIDIHGMKLNHKELIEIYPNEVFKQNFDLFSFNLAIKEFKEDEQYTICEEMNETIAALEVEIREDGRLPTIDETKYNKAIMLLEHLLSRLVSQVSIRYPKGLKDRQ